MSVSSLRALMEQNVDIPVPRARGGLVGRRVNKVSPRDRIQLRFLEQNTLTFQFRVVEVFEDLVMDKVQQLHPLTHVVLRIAADEAFTGFSRTFPQHKKSARLGPHSGSGTECGL